MSDFATVAQTSEIALDQTKLVDVEGDDVVVVNLDGTFFAFANECTHTGGPLVEGELEGETVICPWHQSKFNVQTGAVLGGPASSPLPTYQVRIEGDDVQVAKP